MYDSIALTLREHRRSHPDASDVLDDVASDLATLADDKNEFLVTCEHPDGNPFTRVVAERGPTGENNVFDNLAKALASHRDDAPKVIDELAEKVVRSIAKVGEIDQAAFLRAVGVKHSHEQHRHPPKGHPAKKSRKK